MLPDKPHERRWELPNRELPFYDYPEHPACVARALFWYCSYCGIRYSEVRAWRNSKPAIWQGISGCCSNCPGSRFGIPNSIETAYLLSKSIPQTILE